MLDLIFIGATALFVIGAVFYIRACEKLRGAKLWASRIPLCWLSAGFCSRTCFTPCWKRSAF